MERYADPCKLLDVGSDLFCNPPSVFLPLTNRVKFEMLFCESYLTGNASRSVLLT